MGGRLDAAFSAPVLLRISSPLADALKLPQAPFVTVADPDMVAPETTTLPYTDLLTRYIPNSRWDQTYLTR